MKIDILTLFPEMFRGPFDCSILKRAEEKKLIKIEIHNLRDWAEDKHKTVDDRPFGGGAGMVLKVGIIDKALQSLKKRGAKLKLVEVTTGTENQAQRLYQKTLDAQPEAVIKDFFRGDEVIMLARF